MPGLMVTIGGNATGLKQVFTNVEQMAESASLRTQTAMRRSAMAIEKNLETLKQRRDAQEKSAVPFARGEDGKSYDATTAAIVRQKNELARLNEIIRQTSTAGNKILAIESGAAVDESALARFKRKIAEQTKADGPAEVGMISGMANPRGMKGMAEAAKAAAIEMEKVGEKAHVGSRAVGELIVIGREIGRGNWMRVPGSLTVLVQQFGMLSSVLLSLPGIAFIAVAAGLFALWHHANRVSEGISNLNKIFGRTTESFSEAADKLKNLTDATARATQTAAEYYETLKKIKDTEFDLAAQTEETISAMRKKASLQEELASATFQAEKAEIERQEKNGEISRTEAAHKRAEAEKKERKDRLDAQVQGMKDEIATLDLAAQQQQESVNSAEIGYQMAKETASGPEAVKRDQQLRDVEEEITKYKKIAEEADKVREQILAEQDNGITGHLFGYELTKDNAARGDVGAKKRLAEMESEYFTVNVDGKPVTASLAQLNQKAAFNQNNLQGALEAKTTYEEQERADKKSLQMSEEKFKKETDNLRKLQKDRVQIGDDLKNKEEFGAKILEQQQRAADANAEKDKKTGGGQAFSITQNQRIGAYVGGPQLMLLNEAKIHTTHLREIAKNTGRTGANHHRGVQH